MTITARIIADSMSPDNIRLTTMQLRYPKFIHGEFMTHRVFSRNASSSRAIPVERMIQDVIDDPAMPVWWGANQKGMQARVEVDDTDMAYYNAHGRVCTSRTRVIEVWLQSRDKAVRQARLMSDIGLHKQIVNRIIEPWCHINVVVTSTDWMNFFALRCHPDAQPEMRVLADTMAAAFKTSEPRLLKHGEWHLPYLSHDEMEYLVREMRDNKLSVDAAIRICVARCGRVSYLTHEGNKPNLYEDLDLYDRLVASEPLHASPAEHQATPDMKSPVDKWMFPAQHGNLYGWRQYRKMLSNEDAGRHEHA